MRRAGFGPIREHPAKRRLLMTGKRRVIAVIAGAATVGAALASALATTADAGAVVTRSARADAGPSWGKGLEVPGLAALNTAGNARVSSVSCASPGNCSADGYFSSTKAGEQGFVAAE